MSDISAPDSPAPAPSLPWAIAGAASLGAALVHGAAAGSHASDRQLASLFALTAVAQTAWAVWAIGRRAGRATAVAGILLHGVSLAALVMAWTTGIGFLDGVAERQERGLQDGVVAGLEAIAVVAAAAMAVRPATLRPRRAGIPALAAAVLLVAAAPGMAAPHEHNEGAEHDGEQLAAGHEHDDAHQHGGAPHGESGHHDADVADADDEVVPAADDITLPVVAGVTPEQQQRARDLVRRTREGLARFADPAAAEAAGFISIGDGFTGFEHYIHYGYIADPTILDANEPESIVYKVASDGGRQLASAMYILPTGTTMADVPDVAGALTPWHDHRNLCWGPDGRLAGVVVNGRCRPGGELRITPPMLHVWVIDHVCGPFAGIEDGTTPQTPGECASHSH